MATESRTTAGVHAAFRTFSLREPEIRATSNKTLLTVNISQRLYRQQMLSNLHVSASVVYRLKSAGNLTYKKQFIEAAPTVSLREELLKLLR